MSQCPACDRGLQRMKLRGVVLDVCQGGCGGVWFDAAELERLNAAAPVGNEPLAEISRGADLVLDESRERFCLRCRQQKLEQKLFSLGTGVIMDCCPKCGGRWLDFGELATIREETHPVAHPVRHIVERASAPRSIKVTFAVIQQVQHLRVQQ